MDQRQNVCHIENSISADAEGQLEFRNNKASSSQDMRGIPTMITNLESPEIPRNHERSRLSLPVAYRACERRYLPLEINGKMTYGLPDNALIGNAMTEEWARFIGAKIEHSPSKHSFVNAKGQSFESIGTTQLVVSIPEPLSQSITTEKEWGCSFAVVKQLAAPLVLGAAFLQETRTLTNLAYLLVKKTLSVTKRHLNDLRTIWRFMHMGSWTQNLDCFLDNERLLASLDTGSDIDAVSLEYARSRSWEIQPSIEDESYVLLANNELVKLSGYVETTLRIKPRCDSKEQCVPKKLFVLDGLVCDVVLGDSTIESLNIFDEYSNSIAEAMEPEGMDAFRMIQWIEKIDQMANELEHLVLDDQDATEDLQKKNGWASIFRRGALRKNAPVEAESKMSPTRQRHSVLIQNGSDLREAQVYA